ncbi:MAG: Gfo/Idh/MocA family protein, partial [Janthinobacterium lividum]
GADLMTVMEAGKAPLTVTAVTQTDKPQIYPNVEDDATVILRYPGMQAVLMPSWDWSFARKDMEVYGTEGAMTTLAADHVMVRLKGQDSATTETAPPLPADQSSSLKYLEAVLRGKIQATGDLSALDTNITVMQILSAARTSAQTGKTVTLQPLPR